MKPNRYAFLNLFLMPVAFIAVAFLLRVWPLGSTGTRFPWLTFYPAVMAAAVFGGIWAGVLSSLLAAGVVWIVWPLALGGTPIKDGADVIGLVVFLLNCILISLIAERARRAQTRAERAQEKAEIANRSKSVFLANMSHELRTPLNAILGFSKLMQADSSVSTEHRQTLDIINRSGEHLLSLINDVLDMAKIEAGRSVVENSAFDLQAMIRDVATLMRQRAEAKGLQLTLDLPAQMPRAILADERKLRQVVLNLVGNAVKFTAQGGVTLRVAIRPMDTAHRVMLGIEIADTGAGIAAEDQERIFDPFVQLKDKSANQIGTGLGLTITRQFVELMGGVIHVESPSTQLRAGPSTQLRAGPSTELRAGTLGKGSTFRVEIPVETTEASAIAPAETKEARITRLVPGQPEHRVLIIDDMAENWQLLRRLLEQSGFPVRVAEDGAAGVEIFQTWRPDFIWMDWRMPVMDGLEATRRIRLLPGGRTVKIVVLSASVFKEEREQVLAAGADDFVPKPIQFNKIYECMTKHLGVRFIADEPQRPVAADLSADVAREALTALSSAHRTALADALVSLDGARIAGAIHSVAVANPALGSALEQYAGRFQYTMILQALQSIPAYVRKEEATI